MIADAANPLVGHRQVILHYQLFLSFVQIFGYHLTRANTEIGPHHKTTQLVGNFVEHRWRIVAMVFQNADIGRGHIH